MTTIPLNRRFYEWRDDGLDHASYGMRVGLSDGMLRWTELLIKRRVVILAEAGSGKTVELKEQARLQIAGGKFAFYATVQDVGRDGLDRALRPADRSQLQAWRASLAPGWFFMDSIDEAKLDNIRLGRALKQLAEAIAGGEGRAHIVLSGRHTDWEFARDVRRFNDELPIPRENTVEPLPPVEMLIQGVLRQEAKRKPPPAETALVVVMAPLEDEQMRAYARAKNAPDIEILMAAVETANLQDMARRPLDLDWIVRYWRSHRRLGSFTAMLEGSLRERLRETDPERARRDRLDTERAMRGLERIGAALVFGRQATIAIPDNEISVADDRAAATLDGVLPDWSNEDRLQLLTRPAFDPATFGRARLHNDNEGVVRAYLAARWLHRLRQANLPLPRLLDLLFARSYEIDLIKPSMQETAAWLSLWDEDVVREVARRAPFLLFTAGDPACLPARTRQALLIALVDQMRRDEEVPLLDLDSLRRFAQPDLASALRTIWVADKGHDEIRRFLLRLIWLGAISECADLAASASFGLYDDRHTAIVSGRALVATADESGRRAYAAYIKRHCASIATTVVWEAVESFFPRHVDVDDLVAILGVVRLGDDEGGGFNLDWNGPDLVQSLTSAIDLTRFIEGLLRLTAKAEHAEGKEEGPPKDDQFTTTLAAAARQLLVRSTVSVAPAAAIDAVLRIGAKRFDRTQRSNEHWAKAVEQLHRTPERRRAAFWRAVEVFGGEAAPDQPLLHPFQMHFLGWPTGLVAEDIDWLLADGPSRELANERRLAINAALDVWLAAGEDAHLKAHIVAVAERDTEMSAAYAEWMRPRVKSADEMRSEANLVAIARTREREQSEQEQSWVDFIARMRADPDQLRQVEPTTATTVDGRFFNLWQLLNQATKHSSRYAIDSVAPIVEIAGDAVAAAFGDGLSKIWRAWKPTLRSARSPGERNVTSMFDCMGLAGVSIEAQAQEDWAQHLTGAHAIRAAEYATLEINGYPKWIADLAAAWPGAVEQVLSRELASDLDDPTPDVHYRTLEDISRADESLARLMAPTFLRELESRRDVNQSALSPVLLVLARGLAGGAKRALYELVLDRFHSSSDTRVSALYVGAAYAIDDKGATDALVAKLDRLDDAQQTALVQRVLPQLFGSRLSRSHAVDASLDLVTLERLVRIAFRTVRVEADRDRVNQGVYSPDERDDAQEARSAAFKALVSTPGRAAFDTILRLLDVPGFPVAASRLRALAHARAAEDAEAVEWEAGEALRFEQQFERAPLTGRDLQLVAMQRLEEMQHDLVHGDFQQGTTLSALPNEAAVQNWIADRLRRVQGNAYSIEREVHVANEKEPDLRFRAKASDANVAAEIKLAGTWSLQELEDALIKQLCGQYLRSRDGREGIFLLVLQTPRPKGWKLPDGMYLSFEALVERLRNLAATIRIKSPSAAQPEVCVIDVSDCAQTGPAQIAKTSSALQSSTTRRH